MLATSAKLNEPVDFVWRQVLEMKSSGTASALTAATVRTLTATGGSSSTQGAYSRKRKNAAVPAPSHTSNVTTKIRRIPVSIRQICHVFGRDGV